MPRIPVALVQFDAVPEQVQHNVDQIQRLVREAHEGGARWIMFHEATVCDYTLDVPGLSESVPAGPSTQQMLELARSLDVFISFGLSEADDGRLFITQVFVGPGGMVHRYRKTWLWRVKPQNNYRNEFTRYDPGMGPQLFEIDGVQATCFICADGESRRCIERATALRPQVVFYPNNRQVLPEFAVFGERARQIGAPMLVTNRIGQSWQSACKGGCVVYGSDGQVLATANRQGRQEILHYDLRV